MKGKNLVFILLLALLGSSCTSDYRYAKQFLRKHRFNTKNATEQIYLHLPTTVYHTNTTSPDDLTRLSSIQIDSLRAERNRLLDALNDSIFLDQFSQSLISTLKRTHIPIVQVSDESLLPPPSRDCLILDVTDLEAEEFVEHCRSSFSTRNGAQYHYDHDLRHFSVNAWFQLNYDTSYYFLNQEISEEAQFRGTVITMKDKKSTLKVELTPLTINDAYTLARELGHLSAVLYIEKVLYEHVNSKQGKNNWYLFYNDSNNDINVLIPFETGLQGSFEIVE